MALSQRNVLILVSLLFALANITVAQQKNQTSSVSGLAQESISHTTITVTDKYGRYVSGLSQDRFTILDEKIPQEIVAFEQQDEPFSLAVVFDVSQSIPADGIDTAREELLRLVETGNKLSDYAIIGFSTQTSMLTEFARDRESLVAGINKVATLKRREGTAFYDAVNLALEKVQTTKQKKRIVLLISDGDNNYSNSRINDLREKLKKTDVLVYAMGFSEPRGIGRDLPWTEPGIPSRLITLCSITGGIAFYPRNSAELKNVFEAFALELKSQYSVTFRPSSFVKDGEWRRLKYKVARPNKPGWEKVSLDARGREGYFFTKLP
jgi:Ca-activated chloride channel family protein